MVDSRKRQFCLDTAYFLHETFGFDGFTYSQCRNYGQSVGLAVAQGRSAVESLTQFPVYGGCHFRWDLVRFQRHEGETDIVADALGHGRECRG